MKIVGLNEESLKKRAKSLERVVAKLNGKRFIAISYDDETQMYNYHLSYVTNDEIVTMCELLKSYIISDLIANREE